MINEIADKHKYGVIREYVGHGVGKAFHSAPHIQHFRNNSPGFMKQGETFTIEPMLVQVRTDCFSWLSVHDQFCLAGVCQMQDMEGQVDGGDGGRGARSSVRAHPPDHSRRRGDLDGKRRVDRRAIGTKGILVGG